jgi:hypothetical protein
MIENIKMGSCIQIGIKFPNMEKWINCLKNKNFPIMKQFVN